MRHDILHVYSRAFSFLTIKSGYQCRLFDCQTQRYLDCRSRMSSYSTDHSHNNPRHHSYKRDICSIMCVLLCVPDYINNYHASLSRFTWTYALQKREILKCLKFNIFRTIILSFYYKHFYQCADQNIMTILPCLLISSRFLTSYTFGLYEKHHM